MVKITKIPPYVAKYFWGDNLKDLSWDEHKEYIVQTILEKGDRKSIAWLFSKLSKKKIKEDLPNLKLTPKSKNFWFIYLT